eukprot:10160703-Heterocapsa_arctica.AAC.1
MVSYMTTPPLVQRHHPVDAPHVWPQARVSDTPSEHSDRPCLHTSALMQDAGRETIGTSCAEAVCVGSETLCVSSEA